MNNLRDMLQHGRLVVVCGSGGVGKTTMSASLGAFAAHAYQRRVLVLTVDPARRLADALGLGINHRRIHRARRHHVVVH